MLSRPLLEARWRDSVAGDIRGGKGARAAIEDSDDDGEVFGVDCAAEAEGEGLLALWLEVVVLQREAGAAGMEPFRYHSRKLSQLHREFQNVASNGNDRQFDFDLREMTQGHQGEGPRQSTIFRKDMQVLLKRPFASHTYHLSRMDHERRDKFQSDSYTTS